jgi:hypothetical protein
MSPVSENNNTFKNAILQKYRYFLWFKWFY